MDFRFPRKISLIDNECNSGIASPRNKMKRKLPSHFDTYYCGADGSSSGGIARRCPSSQEKISHSHCVVIGFKAHSWASSDYPDIYPSFVDDPGLMYSTTPYLPPSCPSPVFSSDSESCDLVFQGRGEELELSWRKQGNATPCLHQFNHGDFRHVTNNMLTYRGRGLGGNSRNFGDCRGLYDANGLRTPPGAGPPFTSIYCGESWRRGNAIWDARNLPAGQMPATFESARYSETPTISYEYPHHDAMIASWYRRLDLDEPLVSRLAAHIWNRHRSSSALTSRRTESLLAEFEEAGDSLARLAACFWISYKLYNKRTPLLSAAKFKAQLGLPNQKALGATELEILKHLQWRPMQGFV